MSRRAPVTVSVLFTLVGLLTFDSRPTPAQTSIGFTNPGDLSALLAYRLPSWGFNSAMLDLQLSGKNQNNSTEDSDAAGTQALRYYWFRESEKRKWTALISQTADWTWTQTGVDSTTQRDSGLNSALTLSSSTRNYLAGNTYVVGRGSVLGQYFETRNRDGRALTLDRHFTADAQLGAGIGRQRNVRPLIEAARLNERLRALGRPPLPLDQEEQIAQVLARAGGYSAVFDRPDRRLWRDVLEPIIGMGAPLSPYEVLYLRDASFESLGSRIEGTLAEAGIELVREGRPGINPLSNAGPWLTASWSHNLSLDHQLSATLAGRYFWYSERGRAPRIHRQSGSGVLSASHLWVVADRIYWNNTLSDDFRYEKLVFSSANSSPVWDERSHRVNLNSRLSYFVEDRLALSPEFGFNWTHIEDSSRLSVLHESRTYFFRLGLNYRLAGALL